MGKGDWGKPAYKGSENPIDSANYFMLILVLILVLGFIQAGIKKGWFSALMKYLSQ